jgi:hypothetical protein
MKETHEDPPHCVHPAKRKRQRPQRGDQYWYLSNSMFDMSRAQWDDDGTDEERWQLGNVFLSLEQAEHARKKIKEVLLTLHQEHV